LQQNEVKPLRRKQYAVKSIKQCKVGFPECRCELCLVNYAWKWSITAERHFDSDRRSECKIMHKVKRKNVAQKSKPVIKRKKCVPVAVSNKV